VPLKWEVHAGGPRPSLAVPPTIPDSTPTLRSGRIPGVRKGTGARVEWTAGVYLPSTLYNGTLASLGTVRGYGENRVLLCISTGVVLATFHQLLQAGGGGVVRGYKRGNLLRLTRLNQRVPIIIIILIVELQLGQFRPVCL
jgi:hypothetical protein